MENMPNMRSANTIARETVARNSREVIFSAGCMELLIEGRVENCVYYQVSYLRAYLGSKRKMRMNTKGMDARRGAKPMVMRAATRYLRSSGCGSSPPSPPSRPGRSADAVSGGVLARLATPQTPLFVHTLRASHALRALRCPTGTS